MFGIFNKDKHQVQRSLTQPEELQKGDIVVLKERRALPSELQGQQLEVTHVGTYQYSDGMQKELTLRSVDNKTYYLSVDDNDGDPLLCFAIKIPMNLVLEIFDEDEFAALWEHGSASLHTNENKPEEYTAWLSSDYKQTVNNGEGYFYDRDCSDDAPSSFQDDDGEEFRFHECTSMINSNYSLSVEIWEDGETDVFLEVATATDVIAELWPHGN